MAILSPTILRDPIHNYISVSRLEKTLIDHPLFQRLKYITQNGLAHSVYPSNRTSRFSHSLGAMHIGSAMLMEGLANASENERQDFLRQIQEAVKQCMSSANTTWEKLATQLRRLDDPFYRKFGLFPDKNEKTTAITITLQSLRLACIMHDVGHFPFSHTLEHVLDDYSRHLSKRSRSGKYDKEDNCALIFKKMREEGEHIALHEAIGTKLTEIMLREFPDDQESGFSSTCFNLAKRIVSKKDTDAALRCLNSIVSGKLDADRCDYVRRDGFASGFEFGDFDLQRILTTLHFRHTEGYGWELLPTTVAVSALESFFLERYRIYKWLVFHPFVVLTDTALSRAVTILLEIYYEELTGALPKSIKATLEEMRFNRLWKPMADESLYGDLSTCDEPWLLTLMQEVRIKLAEKESFQDIKLAGLKAYLELVCCRRKYHFVAVWKQQAQYGAFCRALVRAFVKGQKRSSALKDAVAQANLLLEKHIRRAERKDGVVQAMRLLEEEIQRNLPTKFRATGLVLKMLFFTPYEEYYVYDPSTKTRIRLSQISTIIRGLNAMWREEVRLRPFVFTRRQNENRHFLLAEKPNPDIPSVTLFGEVLAQVLQNPKFSGKPRV